MQSPVYLLSTWADWVRVYETDKYPTTRNFRPNTLLPLQPPAALFGESSDLQHTLDTLAVQKSMD